MNIIIDTREKYPWNFSFFDINCISKKLDYGDYSIEGLEDIVSIERKRNSGELANNFGQSINRFNNEFKRMSLVENKYVICEFPYTDLIMFPENSGIPKKIWSKLKITSKFLISQVNEFEEKYKIQFLFFNNKEDASLKAYEILTNIAEKYGKKEMAF